MTTLSEFIIGICFIIGAAVIVGTIMAIFIDAWKKHKELVEKKQNALDSLAKDMHRISQSMDSIETAIRKKGLIG